MGRHLSSICGWSYSAVHGDTRTRLRRSDMATPLVFFGGGASGTNLNFRHTKTTLTPVAQAPAEPISTPLLNMSGVDIGTSRELKILGLTINDKHHWHHQSRNPSSYPQPTNDSTKGTGKILLLSSSFVLSMSSSEEWRTLIGRSINLHMYIWSYMSILEWELKVLQQIYLTAIE